MAKKWNKAAHIVWEELDGGALLVDAKTGARWSLNATAAAIWNWCDGHNTLDNLATRLAGASERTLGAARREVQEFCARFAAQKMLAVATKDGRVIRIPASHFSALNAPATFNALGLGHGPRSRPGPRGNSSPG